VRGSRSVRK